MIRGILKICIICICSVKPIVNTKGWEFFCKIDSMIFRVLDLNTTLVLPSSNVDMTPLILSHSLCLLLMYNSCFSQIREAGKIRTNKEEVEWKARPSDFSSVLLLLQFGATLTLVWCGCNGLDYYDPSRAL